MSCLLFIFAPDTWCGKFEVKEETEVVQNHLVDPWTSCLKPKCDSQKKKRRNVVQHHLKKREKKWCWMSNSVSEKPKAWYHLPWSFLGIILEMKFVYFPQHVELLSKASALCPALFLCSFWQPKSHVLFSLSALFCVVAEILWSSEWFDPASVNRNGRNGADVIPSGWVRVLNQRVSERARPADGVDHRFF